MMQPMSGGPPWVQIGPLLLTVGQFLTAVGIVGLVLGFAIILWINRDPDESPDHWRSHRRR